MRRVGSQQDEQGGRALPARLDPRAGRSGKVRDAVDRPAPPRPVRRGVVVVRFVGAVLSVVLLATTGWGWYLSQVAQATVRRTDAIPSLGNNGIGSQSAMNLLLVGSDSRADLTKAELLELNAGVPSGTNTDTMMLVHIPADGSRASFVSFPRDSYVQIPGHGWDKLNSAYAYGYADTPSTAPEAQRASAGEQLLVKTISELTGLQIDHYAEVDLLGFFKLATVVGGVQVNLCKAVNDPWSGAHFPAGVQTISGADALKFVRQRHGLLRGDFDRIIRQQVFIAGVLRKMMSNAVLTDLGKQRALVQAAATTLTVDQNLDLLSLGQQMQSLTAGHVQFQTIPYVGDSADSAGRYILRLKDLDTLHTFFANLSADPTGGAPAPGAATTTAPPAAVAPSSFTVAVLNGSGTRGLAAAAAGQLRGQGFVVGSTGNADATTYTRTEIRFAAGDEARASAVATVIPGATTVADPAATAGVVQVVLGSSFTRVGASASIAPAAGAAAPTAPRGEDARTAADTTCIS
ncbi:MAG TPA: LCP family protein [Blastococcus sp.]|nr:LCP family protein [Blastococcus sp.]